MKLLQSGFLNEIAKTATITRMPTPVGHALGGLATAWFSESIAGKPRSAVFTIACVTTAAAADVDVFFHSHRTYTHSLSAALLAGLVAWLVVRRRARAPAGIAIAMAAAYGTHVLLDWLGKDTSAPIGLPALWPFSARFYASGADLFMEVSRRYWKPDEFVFGNLKAAGWEVLALAPIVAVAWWLRSQRLNR